MNILKTTVLGTAMALALSPGAQASEINVGGVVFDPDYTDGAAPPVEQDFLARFNFTQWYSTTSDAIATLGSYGSAATIGAVQGSQTGSSSASSYFLSGAGEFYQVNNPLNDVVISSATGGSAGSFCPGCELTFAFGGIGLNQNGTFDLTNAWARVFVDDTPDFSVPVSTAGIAGNALDGQTWLDLDILDLSFESLKSGLASGFTAATFGINGGLAAASFDPKFIVYNASAYFGTSQTSVNLSSRYSAGGNGSVQANTVPEPGTLALAALGLLGFGFLRGPNITRKS